MTCKLLRKRQAAQVTTSWREAGQSFVEFIFLLAVVMTLSLVLMRAANSRIGSIWESMINVIATCGGKCPDIGNEQKVSLP